MEKLQKMIDNDHSEQKIKYQSYDKYKPPGVSKQLSYSHTLINFNPSDFSFYQDLCPNQSENVRPPLMTQINSGNIKNKSKKILYSLLQKNRGLQKDTTDLHISDKSNAILRNYYLNTAEDSTIRREDNSISIQNAGDNKASFMEPK